MSSLEATAAAVSRTPRAAVTTSMISVFFTLTAVSSSVLPRTFPAPSEVRFVRPRHIGVLSRVPLDVFGASLFLPVGGAASATSVSHGRGPRRREDGFILDRELELQVLAPIVRLHRQGDVMLPCVA